MKTTPKKESGFTLIEIIVSIAILLVIAGLGLFISIDFYKSYSFRSEEDTIVSILQKARSQSVNNIDQTRHGVHFSSPLKYTIFECKSALPQCISYADADTSKDIEISPSYGISVSSPVLPFDVVFDQLSDCLSSASNNCSASPVSIVINDGSRTYTIDINNEGRISW